MPTLGSSDTGLIGHNVSVTQESPVCGLGEKATIGNIIYRYVKVTSSLTQYAFYLLDKDYLVGAALSDSNDTAGAVICVPQIAIAGSSGTPLYAWVATGGNGFRGLVLASCAANVALYTTSTAGSLDDATSSVSLVPGLRALTAVTGAGSTDMQIVGEMQLETVA